MVSVGRQSRPHRHPSQSVNITCLLLPHYPPLSPISNPSAPRDLCQRMVEKRHEEAMQGEKSDTEEELHRKQCCKFIIRVLAKWKKKVVFFSWRWWDNREQIRTGWEISRDIIAFYKRILSIPFPSGGFQAANVWLDPPASLLHMRNPLLLNPKFHLMDWLEDYTVAPPMIDGQTRLRAQVCHTGLVVRTFLSLPPLVYSGKYYILSYMAISRKVIKTKILKDGDLTSTWGGSRKMSKKVLVSKELIITLCMVLAHSLCEDTRPSDLKVSPSDTRR